MGRKAAAAIPVSILLLASSLWAQAPTDEPIVVSTEHPRLLLRPARLRLLRRERERASPRWQQFDALMAGNAPMPERGFAQALYYRIAGNAAAGQQAIAWAIGPGKDLRQQALVFDWCQDLLTDGQRRDLTARLAQGISQPPADDSVATARSRVLAAVAIFDHVPDTPRRELERVVRGWWNGKIVPALKEGHEVIAREDAYPLFEMLHVLRDNTNVELRDSFPEFFKDFPIEHLLSYYPASYPGGENEYRIGAMRKAGEPDLQVAALSRAAEMAMVAYDANSPETQVLQGWLMHDNFMLRGAFGAPYEFLWANPYQPGLSYFHVPLIFHSERFGKLFVRSSWEDSATWFGDFDGVMQLFTDGRISNIAQRPPLPLDEAVICFGQSTGQFSLKLDEEDAVFIVGLKPRNVYRVEVDDEEMFEATTDPSGILELTDVPHGKQVGIRIAGVERAIVPAAAY